LCTWCTGKFGETEKVGEEDAGKTGRAGHYSQSIEKWLGLKEMQPGQSKYQILQAQWGQTKLNLISLFAC
jgi:hypothetical protein